jgi:hypothetical protein
LANDEDNDHSTDPAREGGAFLLEGPITEADARPREREKKDDEYKRRQLLFNFLLVVVGSFTVGVYAYQASIMNSSPGSGQGQRECRQKRRRYCECDHEGNEDQCGGN